MLVLALAALDAACSFELRAGVGEDAAIADVTTTVGCDGWLFAPANVSCEPPVGSLVISGGSAGLDTTSGMLKPAGVVVGAARLQASGAEAWVISVDALTITDVLTVTGSRPLILLVHGGASIAGTIDVSAVATTPGPGGDRASCGASTGGPGTVIGGEGAGGGGGGGGAPGSPGCNPNIGSGDGGAGGAAFAGPIMPLVGGCGGGRGGDPGAPGGAGAPGSGGGAVQITARDVLTIAGTITAAGGGGRGGDPTASSEDEGAGGGGSGGAILVQAPAVSVPGRLCANGGSGGEGADAVSIGAHGTTGTCSATVGATTANMLTFAGDGGDGGHLGAPSGTPAISRGGGGGGGGGAVGRIEVRANTVVDTPAVMSPMWLRSQL
jgi:hypothetical protein